MRHYGTFLAALLAVGCSDRAPLTAIRRNLAVLANAQSDLAPAPRWRGAR